MKHIVSLLLTVIFAYVENAFPTLFPPTRDPLRFSVWFAKRFGAPLFNNVYELEKPL